MRSGRDFLALGYRQVLVASTIEPLRYRRPTPPPRRRRRLWLIPLLGGLVLLALGVAALVRAETKTMPYLTVHRVLPKTVRLPGKPFTPAWPSEGEATVAVEGGGSLGSTGGPRAGAVGH